jgi:hypothetical protein
MIVLIQAVLIVVLQAGTQSWIWVAGVPLAFGMAAHVSCWRAAGRGALAGGLSWLLASLYFYFTSGRIIAGRVAAMFGLAAGSGWPMIIFTGLLGALAAGLAAYAGAAFRDAIRPVK